MNVPKVYDWLVVFFVHEIPELKKDYSEKIVTQIEKAGTTNNKTFLIKDSYIKNDETTITFNLKLFELKEQNDKTFSFCEVNNADIEKPDKDSWKYAFRYVYKNYKSKRKILFTWSHGAAFGINTEDFIVDRSGPNIPEGFINYSINKENKDLQNEFRPLLYSPKNYHIRNDNYLKRLNSRQKTSADLKLEDLSLPIEWNSGKLLKDNNGKDVLQIPQTPNFCKNLEILWISDLAEALNSYLDSKIDLLIMTNCYTQLFENGFMLKDSVKYFIGPETFMYANGYNFEKILAIINKKTTINLIRFSRVIIRDYIQLHKELGNIIYLDKTALFANCLLNDNLIFICFEKIVQLLIENFNKVSTDLKYTRENLINEVSGSDTYSLIDIKRWVKTLLPILKKAPLPYIHYCFFNFFLNKRAKAKHIGKVFIQNDMIGQKKYGFSGASLYFPIKKILVSTYSYSICAYFATQIKSIFKNKSNWDEFLNKYLN